MSETGVPHRRTRPVRRSRLVQGFGALIAVAALSLPSAAEACRDTLADVIEPLTGAVINISTTQKLRGPSGVPLPDIPKGSPFEEFFRDFFRDAPGDQPSRKVNSLGSGFVIDPSGLIVTNNHVIADADEIEVNFVDGSRLKVEEVVGRDQKTDLALLRVKPKSPLTSVNFGDSNGLRVGDCVIAIGNPFGLGGTVTTGIISAVKRDINNGPYDDFLQTDAAINKGNSGGPLFNLQGEVIGVNTAIISPSGSGGSVGIGFAVPANTATFVINQLREFGRTRRGWIGVQIQTVTDEIAESLGMTGPARGALVASVAEDGPAGKAGVQAGDVILRFNEKDVESMRALPRIVARTPINETVKVEVLRNGELVTLNLDIGLLDEDGGEVEPASTSPDSDVDASAGETVLGMSLARLTPGLRSQYGIDETVEGAVITDIADGSPASTQDLRAGDVIMEVTQEKVTDPGAVKRRVEDVKRLGRPRVLLLVSGPTGDIRFVSVAFPRDDQ